MRRPQRPRPEDPAIEPGRAGRKVLLADDDHAVLDRLRGALGELGCELVVAHDGPSALSAIRAHRPDLVVADIEMPGLSGVEICRILKANQGEGGFGFVPVILMTSRDGGKVEGLELGADDYLVKPFDLPELAARVKSMLRLKALQDALLEKNRELDRANRELQRKRAELVELSRTDGLTGLFNRRYFQERLEEEFARSLRYRVPLSCLLLDIDHFKKLNDTKGHAHGDRVLRDVSRLMRQTLRAVDLVARFGGEELVGLLPETGAEEAFHAGERVRAAVEAHGECTASIGVSTCPAPGIDDADALVRTADDCLYAAKAAGRNRVKRSGD